MTTTKNESTWNLRSNSSKEFFKLDDNGKPIDINPIKSSDKSISDFIKKIDDLITKEVPISKNSFPKDEIAAYKKIVGKYRDYLIKNQDYFETLQNNSQILILSQKERINELKETIIELNAKIIHLQNSNLSQKIQDFEGEIKNQVYKNIVISDVQTPQEQVLSYKNKLALHP